MAARDTARDTRGPRKVKEHRVSVGGVVFLADLPITTSASLRDEGWRDETLERHDLAIARWLQEHGARTGDGVRWLRKMIGLEARELAEVLGVTAETVSRWENDRLEIDAVAWVVLGAIVRDRATGQTHTLDALRAARERPSLPDTAVRLEVAR